MKVRIGIDTGPVVAGVIGKSKFIYDLWGDTVNAASRMESHGVPGRIQVTKRLRRRLGDRYRFEPRGTIEVKGKGEMVTYFLLGTQQPSDSSPRGTEVDASQELGVDGHHDCGEAHQHGGGRGRE